MTGGCDTSVPLEVVEKDAAARSALERVGSQTGALVLDLTARLCTPNGCPSRVGDTIRYRDAGHISVDGSAMLIDAFATSVEQLPHPTWLI
jgi:hypothetical protein